MAIGLTFVMSGGVSSLRESHPGWGYLFRIL